MAKLSGYLRMISHERRVGCLGGVMPKTHYESREQLTKAEQ